MSNWCDGRLGHYALLLAMSAGLFLPNLGAPSLWDIDEGHNAEAAREMMESGNWIVPTFNFQLRVDKPALLYWLQMAAYHFFGVNEFAARLPSALASALAVLLIYELGRCMFRASCGLLAGLILASTIAFCGAAHFANPDALLTTFTLLSLFCFWRGYARSWPGWFVAAGVSTGFAVLAKGPVGFVLPSLVALLFLGLTRQLGLLWSWRLVLGGLALGLVALPWYIWVGVDTKADFLRGFLLTHNINRFLSPMENHRGPLWYYLGVLLVGFAPWSAFLGLTAWSSVREWRSGNVRAGSVSDGHLFLWCWIVVYVGFFTAASTKLPNYILPIYPAVALLTARFLDTWRRGDLLLPTWPLQVGVACLALVGVAATAGLLVAGGAVPLAALGGRHLPGLDEWAFLGIWPVLGAAFAWWSIRRQRLTVAVGAVTVASALFVGGLAAGGAVALDQYKAPRPLGRAVLAHEGEPDVRVGCLDYYQPSLVFYCRREVVRFQQAEKALEFLRWPLPVYLFLPEKSWESLQASVRGSIQVVDRHYDLYRRYHVVVVTNRPAHSP